MPPRLDLFRTAGRGGAHRFRHGAHRQPPDPHGFVRRGSIAALLVLGTAATVAGAGSGPAAPDPAVAGYPLAGRADVIDPAARAAAASRSSSSRTGPAPEVRKASPPKSKQKPKPKRPAVPAPIGGLSKQQMAHAATIVRIGQAAGLPERAYVVALATAMQESELRVLASQRIPESYQYQHDGDGYDHDSVGIFQQRPSMGWGTVEQCMDPEYSARKFYQVLSQVPGWRDLPVTLAAQSVQRSAYPYYYAKHEPLARRLVAALT